MKTFTTFAIAICMAMTLSGCVIYAGDHGWDDNNWEAAQKENKAAISELELNAKRLNVVQKMGVPSFSDAFVKDGDEYRILYYRTQHNQSDGETTKDETTPLVFKNDKLIGWGAETLARLN